MDFRRVLTFAFSAFFAVKQSGFFSFEVIHSRAVVPEPFAFHLFGEGLLQEGVDGVGIFYV